MTDPSSDQAPAGLVATRAFRFRLVHLIYIMTLLAISLGTFGVEGVGFAIVGAIWAVIFTSPSRPKALLVACIVLFLGWWSIRALLPGASSAGEAARQIQCTNNLKRIALALDAYHAAYGCLPPARIPDENGKPKHSWRMLILPFMGQQAVYDAYDFDEPWDSPKNRRLLRERPDEYACPAHVAHVGRLEREQKDAYTSYVAVVGPSTAWPGSIGRRLRDVTDRTYEAVLIVESATDGIPWMEPRDMTFADALARFTSVDPDAPVGHRNEDYFHSQFRGRMVVMVDASTRFVRAGVPSSVWSQMLTVNDGAILPDTLVPTVDAPRKLRIGNCIRMGMWIALLLLPLPWVWLNPKSAVLSRTM